MKLQNFNLKNFRSKEWWLQELKDIRWTEILLLIALIMCYFQVVHVKEVAQDPCSFCIVSQPYMGPITCKEYFYRDFYIDFDKEIKLEDNYEFTSIIIPSNKT